MLKGYTDDLDRLQYGGLPVLPEQGSYTLTLPDGVESSTYSGGMDVQLLQFQDAPYLVKCTYNCIDGGEVFFLESFFNKHQGEKFIATLLIGNTELEEFVVQTRGTISPPKTGFGGSFSITYQVVPAIDTCFRDWAVEFGQCRTMTDWALIFKYTQEGIDSLPEAD